MERPRTVDSSGTATTMTDVVILSAADCPNVGLARERVAAALQRVGRPERWRELDRADAAMPAEWGGFASPTVLVDGQDVVVGALGHSACRVYFDADGKLDVAPSVEAIVAALVRAESRWAPRVSAPDAS